MATENTETSVGNAFDRLITSDQTDVEVIHGDVETIDPNSGDESRSDHLSSRKCLSPADFCIAIRNSVTGLELYNLVLANLATSGLYFLFQWNYLTIFYR